MKFNAERELVSVLKYSLQHLTHRRAKILEEVSLGYGIADIVITDLAHSNRSSQPSDSILSIRDINVYVVIRQKINISKIELQSVTGISNCNLDASLNKLKTCGYVKLNSQLYSIDNYYVLPFRNSYAIEAKLRDWKKALKQAYRYKWFAEYSFVVIDSYYSNAALKNLEIFVKYNIGLASISVDGILTRHFTPQKHKPYDYKMQILLSEKIKKSGIC